MLERILIPLDGSPVAERAIAQAARFLRRPGTEVILVRVVETQDMDPEGFGGLIPRLKLEAAEYLAGVSGKLREAGWRVRASVEEGRPLERILETAAREKATLVALASHGRTGLARWVMGSVAEKVVRACPVPVLVLRPIGAGSDGGTAATPEAAPAFRKLLVPIDGGPGSLAAVESAAIVAKLCGSSIVLVHVESRLDFPPGTYSARLVDVPRNPPAGPVPGDPGKRLDHLGCLLAFRGLSVTTLRVGGDAASRIVDLPAELGADVIVMATHGRKGLSRFILGSVAEKVLRQTTLPLLVIPPAGDGP